jgi:magnesium chelatase family protein
MLAKRLSTILPDMSRDEMIESTEIYSVAGLTNRNMPFLSTRPFRSPHHTVSAPAMAGGTSNPKPGEISLAHNGVLFLDEMPEFSREVLETLRQPLEDGKVTIARAASTMTYPSRFMLVCAMNPCKCGWFGHPSGKCKCSESSLQKYRERLSGPLLDRVDMFIETPSLEFKELARRSSSEPSAIVRERVNIARQAQVRRHKDFDFKCNAHISSKQIEIFCALSPECKQLMKAAFTRLAMTARSYHRTLRVARTIADLDGEDDIMTKHLAEAIQYRHTIKS